MFILFHNKANSSSQKSGCSSKGKPTLKVCFMCQAREFGRCTSFGTLPKTKDPQLMKLICKQLHDYTYHPLLPFILPQKKGIPVDATEIEMLSQAPSFDLVNLFA